MNDNRSILEVSEGYKFTAEKNSYSHLLLCKICSKLMIQPSRLYPCGHTFCKSCIIEYDKKVSSSLQSTRQNKCFVPFPQCGKYYITLQPDLLAASLIDDLEVKCLNQGCPWTGPLERFKNYHKDQCKLKEGGLDSWLNDLNEGIISIKKVRQERINSNCIIDIDDKQDEINVLQQSKEDKQSFKQRMPVLGLNKDKVGDQRKRPCKQLNNPSNIVEVLDDDQDTQLERQSRLPKIIHDNRPKQCPIKLDNDHDVSQTQFDQNQRCKASSFRNKSQNTNPKKIQQNYTGLKMITSYKKKNHKIAQNPHNMGLTRSQPRTEQEDGNINIWSGKK